VFSFAPLIWAAGGAIIGTGICVGVATIWLPTAAAIPVGMAVGVFVGGSIGMALGDRFDG
jgi:hypothetical protein